jgi:chromosome segregation ATPase
MAHQQKHHGEPDQKPAPLASDGTDQPAKSSGDSVLDIIADFEQQLQRIRSVQSSSEQQLASLATRSKSLADAESKLEEKSRKILQERETMEQTSRALDDERRKFVQQQRDFEQQIEAGRRELESMQQGWAAKQQESSEHFRRTEAELTQHRSRIDEQRSAMENERSAWAAKVSQFEQARSQWELQKQQAEADIASKQQAMRDRETQLDHARAKLQQREQSLAESHKNLEHECQRMMALEAEIKRDREALTQKSMAHEAERRELLARVEQDERSAAALQRQLEASQAALEKLTKEHAASSKKAQTLETKLEKSQAALSQAKENLGKLQELEDQLKAQVKQESNRAKQAEAKHDESRKAIEKVAAELAASQGKTESLIGELELRQKELAEARKKLDVAGQKLSQFAQMLKEQTSQIERGAEAMATVEEQRSEILHLTEQLAKYKLSTDPEEIVRRDERIRELTEALREARGQSASGSEVGEKEQRIAEMTSTINQLRLDLQQAQVELESAKRAQEEAREDRTGGETDAATVARLAERDARIAELTTRLEQLDSDYSSQRSSAEQHIQEHHGIVSRMQDQIDTLERQLVEAKVAAASRDDADASAKRSDLRSQAKRIKELAEHLRLRKSRLQRLHARLREVQAPSNAHASAAGPSPQKAESIRREIEERARFTEQIHLDRQRLAEVQATLAVAERDMVAKWARPRAIWTMGWCAMLMAMLCVASWFIADHVVPAQVAASVTLHAKSQTGAPMTEDELNQWRDFHVAMLADPQFRSTLAKRFADRQLAPYDNLAMLNSRLDSDLTIDTSVDDKLRFTVSGNDERELIVFLDTLGTTFMKESSRNRGKHSDGAEAVLRGEYKDGSQTRYAALNPTPIEDTRLQFAAITFGVLTAVCFTLFVILSARLRSAQRAFDADLLAPSAGEELESERVRIV